MPWENEEEELTVGGQTQTRSKNPKTHLPGRLTLATTIRYCNATY